MAEPIRIHGPRAEALLNTLATFADTVAARKVARLAAAAPKPREAA